MPPGYCSNFPAAFEIDYVRVYQAKKDPKHFLGCSPPHRPTDLWIRGHAKRYMQTGDRQPLQDVMKGGGVCTEHSECGGQQRGICTTKQLCECKEDWTGPNCKAHAGFYEFELNQTNTKAISSECRAVLLCRNVFLNPH